MDDSEAVEPFGFFTLDALRAGWYLVWRQLVRVVPAALGVMLAGLLVGAIGLGVLGSVISGFGLLAVMIWAAVLVPRLTSQWAEQWYGVALTGPVQIWWGVPWRAFVASLVAAVILTLPNFVALSLKAAFPSAALGMLGGLLTVLLGAVNFAVTLLATGWAMSKVATAQISMLTAVPSTAVAMQPSAAPLAPDEPLAAPATIDFPVSVAAPAAIARPAPVPAAPRPVPQAAVATDKRQCPKCGLYETERGSVIGWYCRVCGWRENRPGR